MDNLNLIIRQFRPIWKMIFKLNSLRYHPIGGGEEEVTVETQAVKITELEGKVTSLTDAATKAGEDFSWKGQLGADAMNSPTLQKFEDTKEGFAKAIDSHLSLEKLLGHDKVPIPKDENDTEGWNRFSKAMGIPDKAESYGLADANIPESMKGMTFDKQKFAETVHAFKLTPNQAKGLWGAYTDMTKEVYAKALKESEEKMTTTVNQLRSEWGDAYDGNVQVGQMVINKFSSDKDMEDFVTSTLAKDPMGIKFLSKIGLEFSENKIGDFKHQRFSLSPEQAQAEIDKISSDSEHPYRNEKSPQAERDKAIDYVNSLQAIVNKGQG